MLVVPYEDFGPGVTSWKEAGCIFLTRRVRRQLSPIFDNDVLPIRVANAGTFSREG